MPRPAQRHPPDHPLPTQQPDEQDHPWTRQRQPDKCNLRPRKPLQPRSQQPQSVPRLAATKVWYSNNCSGISRRTSGTIPRTKTQTFHQQPLLHLSSMKLETATACTRASTQLIRIEAGPEVPINASRDIGAVGRCSQNELRLYPGPPAPRICRRKLRMGSNMKQHSDRRSPIPNAE